MSRLDEIESHISALEGVFTAGANNMATLRQAVAEHQRQLAEQASQHAQVEQRINAIADRLAAMQNLGAQITG